MIKDLSNGDIACDSYNKYEEDVNILKDLGVQHYRFSLSWSRLLPTGTCLELNKGEKTNTNTFLGFNNKINQHGVTYYKNLIKKLRENNIEPFVTLFHWDTPQSVQDLGGWTNELVIKWYTDYAKICFEHFGELVKYWTTFNEPFQICQMGYGEGLKAPMIKSPGMGEYLCAHNILKAHANVWHMYQLQFKNQQNGNKQYVALKSILKYFVLGMIGITLDSSWYQGKLNTTEYQEAAERALHFRVKIFMDILISKHVFI